MNLVSAEQIASPKLKVTPPWWIMFFFWGVAIAILVLVFLLPISNMLIKYVVIGTYALVLLGLVRNQFKRNFLVTMQANRHGLYFQTDDIDQYFFVPWKNVGQIEKAIFPVNRRGLRIEITGKLSDIVKNSNEPGNVMTENGCTYIYTLVQLHNRDGLIQKIQTLRDRI